MDWFSDFSSQHRLHISKYKETQKHPKCHHLGTDTIECIVYPNMQRWNSMQLRIKNCCFIRIVTNLVECSEYTVKEEVLRSWMPRTAWAQVGS